MPYRTLRLLTTSPVKARPPGKEIETDDSGPLTQRNLTDLPPLARTPNHPDAKGTPYMGQEGRVEEGGGAADRNCGAPVFVPSESPMVAHRLETVRALARRIARLRGSEMLDDASTGYLPRCYVVPADTLVGGLAAGRLGIESETDLFGGLVFHAVQAGKAITHPLADPQAPRPDGWSPAFGEAVGSAVLRGFSAFEMPSARVAGEALLAEGPVRLKAAWADGGHGQRVVADKGALHDALASFDVAELPRSGLVIEQDLQDGVTYSIGRLRVGEGVLSYVGRQVTTKDNRGETAYGGSTLTVVPGELDALSRLALDAPARAAVEAASLYDRAAMEHFPGLIASRRNYDVIHGRDAHGAWHTGVLEQSWRIGGASGAEIIALQAFSDNPRLAVVRASCVERYGSPRQAPWDAWVYYDADDAEVGSLIKFARIEARSEDIRFAF